MRFALQRKNDMGLFIKKRIASRVNCIVLLHLEKLSEGCGRLVPFRLPML